MRRMRDGGAFDDWERIGEAGHLIVNKQTAPEGAGLNLSKCREGLGAFATPAD